MHHKLELKQGRGNNLAGLNSLFASKTKIIIFRVAGFPPLHLHFKKNYKKL